MRPSLQVVWQPPALVIDAKRWRQRRGYVDARDGPQSAEINECGAAEAQKAKGASVDRY